MFHAFKGENKRNGTLKCLAILKMPEKRRLEKIVIRVMMSRWSTQFNKENYIEIGRSTFDFPLYPTETNILLNTVILKNMYLKAMPSVAYTNLPCLFPLSRKEYSNLAERDNVHSIND